MLIFELLIDVYNLLVFKMLVLNYIFFFPKIYTLSISQQLYNLYNIVKCWCNFLIIASRICFFCLAIVLVCNTSSNIGKHLFLNALICSPYIVKLILTSKFLNNNTTLKVGKIVFSKRRDHGNCVKENTQHNSRKT